MPEYDSVDHSPVHRLGRRVIKIQFSRRFDSSRCENQAYQSRLRSQQEIWANAHETRESL